MAAFTDGQVTSATVGSPPTKVEPAAAPSPLAAAKLALTQAVNAMRVATPENKGGYVEISRADLDQAVSILTDWLASRQSHPEMNLLPTSPSPAIDALSARIAGFDPPASFRLPSLRTVLKSLHTALSALQRTPGGDADGFRSRLVTSIDRAASDVIAGMNHAIATTGPADGAGLGTRTITPLGPPANATAFYSGSLSMTKRLELARRALEQTESALRLPASSDLDELAVAPPRRDQALATCELARSDLAAALSYIQKYPANDALTGGVMSPEDPPIRLAGLPPALDRNPAGRFTNPPVVAAVDALNEVLNALTNARPNGDDGIPHPIMGELDGYRLKLMRDISQTQTAINAGLNETYDTYVSTHTAPIRPGHEPGKGT